MGKIFRWTLLIVVLVIFASGAVAVYTVFFKTSGDEITMPLLRGMSIVDAERDARRLGLIIKADQIVSSLPQGEVTAQSPEAGSKVRSDKTVLLKISKGGIRRAVPNVRAMPLAEAQKEIQDNGFGIGDIIYIKDESKTGGTVIAQSPSGPANIPSDKKIDLLVSQGGAGPDGRLVVPDVAGMTERRARELLTASGFRIAVVDSIYSPNDVNGNVIGTRPAGGTMARSGDGIRLRVATTQRPQGVPERPVQQTVTATAPQTTPGVTVTVPGHGDILIGNDPVPQQGIQTADPNISVFDQRPAVVQAPVTTARPQQNQQAAQAQQPAQAAQTPPAAQQANLQPVGGKTAKIRYQVPPLARPLQLKIELVDPSGTKVLLERDAKSGEYVSLDAQYSRECVVMIYLGNQFVWQDRYM